MSILSSKEFNIISDISKALRSEYIMFYNDKCYGVNMENNNIIKYTNNNPLSLPYNKFTIFKSTDITEMSKKVKEIKSDVHIGHNNLLFFMCGDLTISSVILPNNVITNVFNSITIINAIHTREPLLVENDLKSNENFMKILDLSASDGMGFFAIDKFMMSMFNNLVNVNKSDFVSLGIYKFDETSFLSRFIINKKKFILDINIRYMYMNPR